MIVAKSDKPYSLLENLMETKRNSESIPYAVPVKEKNFFI